MPELPDVELVRRSLAHALGGATIRVARSADRWVLRPKSPSAFSRALVGRTVCDVGRRGKWLRVLLDDGGRLFSHLGMTGWWEVRDRESPRERFERARIDITRSGGRSSSLRYVDSRRFGRLLVSSDDIPEWQALGLDPLLDGLDVGTLVDALGSHQRRIKDALMDQSIIAGVGNILATEALWLARIDPRSRSDALSRADVSAVARALRTEIRRELAGRDQFDVYGHAGQPCPRCGSPIARVIIAGRTTTFCKRCQRRA